MRVNIHLASVKNRNSTYEALLPEYKTEKACGADIRTPYPFTLKAGDLHIVDTGLIIKAPRGYNIDINSRSGLAIKQGVIVQNAPGYIDGDYCGPEDRIRVALRNVTDKDVKFERGDRIAQLKVVPYVVADWMVQPNADFADSTSRGGLGSTGIA